MTILLHSEAMQRAVSRMAHELVERNDGVADLVFIGLQTRGVFIAKRLASEVKSITGKEIVTGELDISMHRDDLNLRGTPPVVKRTDIPAGLDGKTVVLVDDVLFTGRSTRAAMDALNDFGRPRRIQLAVLVDRGNRELPIQPDYVGKDVATTLHERINVKMKEADGLDEVTLEKS